MNGNGAFLVGADRAAFVAALCGRLRAAGAPVALSAARTLTAALDLVSRTDPTSIAVRSRLYWLARTTLVRDAASIAVFDKVFAAVFDDAVFSLDPAALRGGLPQRPGSRNLPVPGRHSDGSEETDGGLPWATLPRITVADSTADDEGTPIWTPLPNAVSALAHVPFEDLNPKQLAQVERWLIQAAPRWPTRRSRRQRRSRHGKRVDLRGTIARAGRTEGEILTIAAQRRVPRSRNVIMVCDVSQSMQPYASAYLHVMRALARSGALGARATHETFAFATQLTRMTPMLRRLGDEEAIREASAKITDRFGGTRIAHSLAALLRTRHAQQLRGAICVIASDGWDSDPPELMDHVMGRIARRAFRVVWLNPRAGQVDYQPRVAGMAAALPHCDDFLPAGTVADLGAIIQAITDGRDGRRGRVRPGRAGGTPQFHKVT